MQRLSDQLGIWFPEPHLSQQLNGDAQIAQLYHLPECLA